MLEKQNEYIGDKISIVEMRQCQANAEKTDASRMKSMYFKAENALWSSSAHASTLEKMYKSGEFPELLKIYEDYDKMVEEKRLANGSEPMEVDKAEA